MKAQLEQYVDLLFAGAKDCDDIKQEILQNTLDRYDDLIAEGKVPQAAYRLAIAGIGDINEVLGDNPPASVPQHSVSNLNEKDEDTPTKKLIRAIAIGLYIISPIPLLALADTRLDILGLCILLFIVAVATIMIVLCARKDDDDENAEKDNQTPRQQLQKSIDSLIWSVGLVVYFAISFLSNSWHITWLVFPMIAAVQNLAKAILDLKEAKDYEN